MSERIPLIAGNWKMNLDHQQAIAHVQKLAWTLRDVNHDFDKVEVAVFPPFTDLRSIQTLVDADKLALTIGAQDLSIHDSGAYTGEISGAFLRKLDCKYVLVGHSERRINHNETDSIVSQKVKAAGKHGMIPIICVGENLEQLEEFGPAAIPVEQLRNTISDSGDNLEFVVAYEPVWAIGTGKVATAEQADSVAKALRGEIAARLGEEVADSTRILYGGSVKANNVAGFLASNDVDGVLVGGASLDIDEFTGICRFQKHLVI